MTTNFFQKKMDSQTWNYNYNIIKYYDTASGDKQSGGSFKL